MRVGVTGSNGFLGSKVVEELRRNGVSVLGLQRGADVEEGGPTVSFSLENVDAVSESLTGLDAIIHVAAAVHKNHDAQTIYRLNTEATKRLTDLSIQAGVKKFVFISTVGVYGKSSSLLPLKLGSPLDPQSDYARSKLQAEYYINSRREELKVSIIRLPLIVGGGALGTYGAFKRICELPIPLPFRNINNQRSVIDVKEAASAIGDAGRFEDRYTGTHILVGKTPVSTLDLATRIRSLKGMRLMFFSLPQNWIRFCCRILGKQTLYEQLFSDLVFEGTIDLEAKSDIN